MGLLFSRRCVEELNVVTCYKKGRAAVGEEQQETVEEEEEPEPEAPEEPEADYGVPLDLQHYLSGDHYSHSHHHHRPRYPAPAPSAVLNPPGLDLTPVKDDLSFLFDHRPHVHHGHHGHHSRPHYQGHVSHSYW